jgi:hypothetical protein
MMTPRMPERRAIDAGEASRQKVVTRLKIIL